MQAIILAADMGKRLGNLTQNNTKQVESRLSKYCYYPESEPSTTN